MSNMPVQTKIMVASMQESSPYCNSYEHKLLKGRTERHVSQNG